MVRNKEKYVQVTELRKRGFTYSEIAKLANVSKATVSNWLKNDPASQRMTVQNKKRAAQDNVKRIKLVHKARQKERAARYKEAVRSAETEYKHYKHNPLFTAGVMLYRACGDQTESGVIRFTTTDMGSHAIFVLFLQEFLGVEKQAIRCWVIACEAETPELVVKRWSKALKLSPAQFGKTQYLKSVSSSLKHETGNIIVSNTVLKKKLLQWHKMVSKDVLKKRD